VKKLSIAPISKRATAYFIDDIVVSLFLLIIFYDQLMSVYQEMQGGDLMPMVNFLESNTITFILLRIVYQTFFVWQSGMTLGKMFMKIKVVELESGKSPPFLVAFLRASMRVISDSIFYLGYILAYFNPLVQTLHDKLAKTIVVNV
jgi:uncharacterized RDD family membrane protein YckC